MRESAPNAEFVLVCGDLTSECTPKEFGGIRDVFPHLKLPVHVMPGNHDITSKGDLGVFDKFFPGARNHAFEHRGWQVFCLNSVESRGFQGTNVPKETLEWAAAEAKKFDPKKPTLLATHFPMGLGLARRPKNADALLAPFKHFDVRHIFNGHWHGYTETIWHDAPVTTDRCCSRYRGNHDGSLQRGWFVCQARQGRITRRFVAPPELAADSKSVV